MTEIEYRQPSKAMFWIGWVLTAIPALMMVFSSFFAITMAPMAVQGMVKYGYPANVTPFIGLTELLVALLLLIPRTAVLGAILLTAYLGGAVATHLRVGEPQWVVPVIFALAVWVGLFLRRPWLLHFLRKH